MNENLLVRSESEDDVGVKSPSLSSLKSFRDTFKRSESVTSLQASATSNSTVTTVPHKRKNGKLNEDKDFFYSTICYSVAISK